MPYSGDVSREHFTVVKFMLNRATKQDIQILSQQSHVYVTFQQKLRVNLEMSMIYRHKSKIVIPAMSAC